MVPEGINGAEVIARAFTRYNLALGAGLSKVAGKLFRIGHLGDLNELMLLGAIAGAEMAMLDVGVKIEPGSGVAAAQNYWRSHRAGRSADAGVGEDEHRGVMHRVVFLDRASLKAKVRKPACASEYIEYDKTAVERDRAAPAGRRRRDHQQGADARRDAASSCRELKMIAVAATGYDVVDVAYCKEHGIAVANIRNYAVHTVPEHAFALILALRRNLLAYRAGRRERRVEQVGAVLLLHARHRRSARRDARHHRRGRDRPGHGGHRPRVRHAGAVRRSSAAEDGGRDVHAARAGARANRT